MDDDVATARTPEEWAMECALKIKEEHGLHQGPQYIARKLLDFSAEGNERGWANFLEIANAYVILLAADWEAKH